MTKSLHFSSIWSPCPVWHPQKKEREAGDKTRVRTCCTAAPAMPRARCAPALVLHKPWTSKWART